MGSGLAGEMLDSEDKNWVLVLAAHLRPSTVSGT